MLGDQVWLTVIVQVSTSQRCWMGLRSGLLTGQLYCCSPDGKIISSWDFLDFVHRCIVMSVQLKQHNKNPFSHVLSHLLSNLNPHPSVSVLVFPSLPLQERVGGDVSSIQLVQLIPITEYSISLYALHGEAASDPLEGTGVTCM